jgi:hypothetical protein
MVLANAYPSQPYPPPEVLAYMERQAEQYEEMRLHLIEQYLNQSIWFEDGQVLDADPDHATLVIRAHGDGEPRPLFVRKVLPIEPQLKVRSPFLFDGAKSVFTIY